MPVKHHPVRWQRLAAEPGDFMEIAWFGNSDRPLLLILHGLEGSYRSHYVQRVLNGALDRDWQVGVLHFRSCGRELNTRMESYHSGVSHDLQAALSQLVEAGYSAIGILGFSLGGNVLLKWLGENPRQSIVQRAMAVSVPLKLDLCASAIDQGFSKLYQKHLIDQLKRKTQCKLQRQLPGPRPNLSVPLTNIKNFWQFDEAVTAPVHGFANAADYYHQASSFYYLPNISTPTLILQSLDDPFMNRDVLPEQNQLGSGVVLEVSEKGGHVGFIDHWQFKHRHCFLANKVADYFGSLLD
jgi:hypothetical protein